MCFHEKDDIIKHELRQLSRKGKSLWCDGLRKALVADGDVTICLDNSDSEDERPNKKRKINALESKAQRVDTLANEFQERHKDKYTKIQYKLWAEALDVKRHSSKESPPAGPMWGTKNTKSQKATVDSMATAFTEMANSVASAFSRPTSPKPVLEKPVPTKEPIGISPGRKVDLQEKLLRQIDLVHKMFEKGAVTSEQFEKRRESLLLQLDKLAD